MRRPRVLIGYSRCQITREAFERAGCEAFTCDLLACPEGGAYHLQGDVWEALREPWSAAILHPMCTVLTVAAAWALSDPDFERYPGVGYHQKVGPEILTGEERRAQVEIEVDNFRRLLELPFPKAIENPYRSLISTRLRPADQCVQPHQFGDDAKKSTGLWLDRLPRLRPTGFAQGRSIGEERDLFGQGLMRWSNQTDAGQNKLPPSPERWLERSATYPGIARAMGAQWGLYLREVLS